ncbi:putative Serine racemase [Nannochloris sp. 'desiccata']|nr:putative Serine racemase [Chlorella desiccata (nom. nud.)]
MDTEACSGNHGIALSYASSLRGCSATVVLPWNSPKSKQNLIHEYGGKLVYCEPTVCAREAVCAQVQAQTGSTFVPSSNSMQVVAGQGTVALEFLEQNTFALQVSYDLDCIIAPVSGGGLIGGIAAAIKAVCPRIKIIAAEPQGTNNAADVAASKIAGRLLYLPTPETIADGLLARLGDITWPLVRDLVDDVIVVQEKEIIQAMLLCRTELNVSVEPSAATALAAALSSRFLHGKQFEGLNKVGIILTGGNCTIDVSSDLHVDRHKAAKYGSSRIETTNAPFPASLRRLTGSDNGPTLLGDV